MTEKKATIIVTNAAQSLYDNIKTKMRPIIKKWRKTNLENWAEKVEEEFDKKYRNSLLCAFDESFLWNALYQLKLHGAMVQEVKEIYTIKKSLELSAEYQALSDDDKQFIIKLFGLDYSGCCSPEETEDFLEEL